MRNKRRAASGNRGRLALAMSLALLGAGCDSRTSGVEQPAPVTTPAPPAGPMTPEPAPVLAEVDVPTLLASRRCNLCHAGGKLPLGPSYQAIAQEYGARRDVMLEILALKIIDGGGGNWGVVPMVPSTQVTIDEARLMAGWILDSRIDQGPAT